MSSNISNFDIHPSINKTIEKVFDPAKLNSGDTSQIENWLISNGMTIFIDWVPDQMTEENARELFEEYGKVARIRFLKKDKKRSAFVDYENWYMSYDNKPSDDIESIAKAFPGYHSIDFKIFVDKNGKVPRTFTLKCRVDRTIQKETITVFKRQNIKPNVVPYVLQRKIKSVQKHVPSIEERILVLEEQNKAFIHEFEILHNLINTELSFLKK